MMWGNGYNMAWGWPVGLLVLVAGIWLVIWAVRTFAGSSDRASQRGTISPAPDQRSPARQILDERLAKGELDATEYRERVQTLDEKNR